jgi:hypothetical protein
MIFNARIDMSHHGLQQPFEDAGVLVECLTHHNVMVKCLFVVTRSCIHNGFYVSPHVKIQRIQIW